jgi:hypothetical protein
MSHLTLPAGIPNFSKAVISLWFRAPKESVIAASGHRIETGVEGWSMLQSVLPLVTFGAPQQNKNYTLLVKDIAHGDPQETVVVETPVAWIPGAPADVDPCYIALVCSSDGTFNVAFNLQMADYGSYSGLTWFATDMAYIPGYSGAPPVGSGIVGVYYQSTIVDGSYGTNNQPEYFYVQSNITLQPDVWHHLLVSFDVGGALTLGLPKPSSTCQLWYAIDDVDYRGWDNLQPYRDADDALSPNTILTSNIYRESGYVPGSGSKLFYNHYVPNPAGSYSPGPIPSAGAGFGLPASAKYVDGIFRCEMAEFQMWTGVILDTEITSNRRAFVDADGKPVNPTKGSEADPRAPAERLLGKKPEVMLHGSSNWKTGYNTGTTGIRIETAVDEDGNETETVVKIPSGQFTPTAKIEKYKPEPALEKTTA